MRERAPVVIAQGTEVRGFLIESELGTGGFGTVFRASRGERRYALKFIRCRDAGGWAKREVEMLLRTSHRNVVGFEGCGFWPDDTREYLVVIMDYVEGQRLDVWAQEENPDARQVARKVIGVARALAALHRAGVMHRDLKEANIIIRASDGEAVLVDLGAAGGANTVAATRDVLPPCTPEYRAPEAWRFLRDKARPTGARYQPGPSDDLYALGVVLYWLLTGRLPCVGATVAEQAEATLHHVPAPAHAVNPRVPGALSALCMKLLEKLPGDRFPDAGSLETAAEARLAEADEAWSVPLCDGYAPDNLTTEGVEVLEDGIEALDRWIRVGRHAEEHPRRGRRPAQAAPAAEPPPVPEAEAAEAVIVSPAPSESLVAPRAERAPEPSALALVPRRSEARPPRAGLPRLLPWVCLVLGSMAVLALAVAQRPPAPLSPSGPPANGRHEPQAGLFTAHPESAWETTWEVGRKMAIPGKAPEDGRHNFFATGAAALVQASPEGEKGKAPMKTPQQRQKKALGAMSKAATGTALLTLACTGPQVRPEPPQEPCPPGAIEAMAGLNIDRGDEQTGLLPGPTRSIIPVREGWTSVRIFEAFNGLPPETTLRGRLIFGGERVFGRFTEAYNGTRTWPVCMELCWDGKRGLELEPGSTAETAKVLSTVHVCAVDRFK